MIVIVISLLAHLSSNNSIQSQNLSGVILCLTFSRLAEITETLKGGVLGNSCSYLPTDKLFRKLEC